MLRLRKAHDPGTTHVSIDGDHILSGGEDGVVSLFAQKRWPTAKPLWARKCHDAAVTHVILDDSLHLSLSCGRDGRVLLHERIHEAEDQCTSRLICKVTGELRCLALDAARHRVFIAGDSLRCLQLDRVPLEVATIKLVVPNPIIAVALSPCGNILATASASGAVGVVCVSPGFSRLAAALQGKIGGSSGDTQTQQVALGDTQAAEPETEDAAVVSTFEVYRHVQFVFDRVLPPCAKVQENCKFALSWCGAAKPGQMLLFAPTASDVRVFRLELDAAALGSKGPLELGSTRFRHVMHAVASIEVRAEFAINMRCVHAYRVSPTTMACVVGSEAGIYVATLNERLAATYHNSALFEAAVTDVQVSVHSGDIAVAVADGNVSFLKKASVKVRSHRAKRDYSEASPAAAVASGAEEKIVEVTGNVTAQKGTDRTSLKKSSREGTASLKQDDFINDGDIEDSDGSDSSSASSSSSSSERSDSDSEGEDPEDLPRVVEDLKRNMGRNFVADDEEERPSAWRRGDTEATLAAAEKDLKKGPYRQISAFLDDEAEEASSADVESENEAALEDDGYGNRQRADTDSITGHAENEDEEEEERLRTEDKTRAAAGGAVTAMLDYSFQVGATPVGEEGCCYLAYNSVGYIHSTPDAIVVHFHDIGSAAVRILEKGTILMGALSPVGAGFVIAPPETAAPESVDDFDVVRLTVYYRTFVALGAQPEWRVRLQPGETVRCITAGIRFVAVATSRYLRIYSISGLELAVLSKFPRIVAMAGTSSKKLMTSFKADFDPLAVAFLEGCDLRVEVLDVGARATVIKSHVVPLTELPDGSAHQLQWMGWSEDGPLHVADTAGVVRLHTNSWGGTWVSVYDPRPLADQSSNLWIWGINDKAMLAYRSSKADSPYPAAVSNGLPTEHVPLFLPLTRTCSEADLIVWDHLVRREIRTDEMKLNSSSYTEAIARHDAQHDKKIIELFENALKDQQTTRALDLATMLELRDNIETCAKLANKRSQEQLMRKLLSLYKVRVTMKSKRRCTLPLEGSLVSEKERDFLLRKLLIKEKNATGATPAPAAFPEDNASHNHQQLNAASTRDSPPPTRATAGDVANITPERAARIGPVGGSTVMNRNSGGEQRRSTSLATTATTVTTDHHQRHQNEHAAKRVTFDIPESSRLPAQQSTSPAKPVNVFAKPANPFASRAQQPQPQPQTSAASQRPATRTQQSTLRSSPSVPSTTMTATATIKPSPAPVTAPRLERTEYLLGDSQPSSLPSTVDYDLTPAHSQQTAEVDARGSTPIVTEAKVNSLVTVGEGTPEEAAGGGSDDRVLIRADVSPTGRTSAARATTTAASATVTKTTTFVPRVLPVVAPAADACDPFLESVSPTMQHQPAYQRGVSGAAGDATADGNEVTVTVEALLDMGHENSTGQMHPLSTSFGEALRKRYREDDDEDAEGEDESSGIPMAFMPKLAAE